MNLIISLIRNYSLNIYLRMDCEESWALKNWCFWTVVLEKALESPLDCKEIQSVHSKEDQSWVFFGRTDAKAETPVLWPPDAKSWLIWKDPDAGRDWGQEKGMTEDEMARWHHWLNGHEFRWTPGVGDGQGGLACCSSWGCRESDTTERLNWRKWRKKTKTWHIVVKREKGQVLLKEGMGEVGWEFCPFGCSCLVWPGENRNILTTWFPWLWDQQELKASSHHSLRRAALTWELSSPHRKDHWK